MALSRKGIWFKSEQWEVNSFQGTNFKFSSYFLQLQLEIPLGLLPENYIKKLGNIDLFRESCMGMRARSILYTTILFIRPHMYLVVHGMEWNRKYRGMVKLSEWLVVHKWNMDGKYKNGTSKSPSLAFGCRSGAKRTWDVATLTLTRRGNVAETQSEKLPYKWFCKCKVPFLF